MNAKVNTLDDQQIAQLQMAKIAKESPGLAKLLQQSQPTQTTATARQYSDSDLALLQGIDKLDGSTNKILAQANLNPKDWALFKDGKLPPTNTQYRTSSTISDSIDKLLNHPGLSDAIGTLKTP